MKQHYEKTGYVIDHPKQGRPHSARTKKVVEDVQGRINQNSCKQKIFAVEMNLVLGIVLHILHDDFGVKSYKKYTGQLLDMRLYCTRLERLKLRKYLYRKELFKLPLFYYVVG